ncbi:hypothetical protein [Erwinia sp. 198]|uniref:hypothetical protein n=1 Tax=Erwinia sp. 198 TaxID=2022746 RepID=UPI0013156681|nr:hypothetical protein [Erwinia sp. 198]
MKLTTADMEKMTRLNAGRQCRFSSFPICRKSPSLRGFFLPIFPLIGTRRGE